MSHLGTYPMARYLRTTTTHETDSIWQGDDLSQQKPSNRTRFMYHNVNGLSLHGIEGLDMFVNDQVNLEVDVQGITEHCLDTTKYQVYQTAQDIARQTYGSNALLYLNSSTEPAVNVYKPGGTGILAIYAEKIYHQ